MKNQLLVTFENNQFVLTEMKQIISTAVLTETLDTTELSNVIQTAGYKNAKFSEDAKAEFRRIEKEIKMLNRNKNDAKRQEREAKKLARVTAQTEKLNARIAKMQEQLAKISA